MTIQELLKIRGLDTSKQIKLIKHTTKEFLNDQHHQKLARFHDEKSGKTIDYVISFLKAKGTSVYFIGVYEVLDVLDIKDDSIDKYEYILKEIPYFKDLSENTIVEWGKSSQPVHSFANKKEIIFSSEHDVFEEEISKARKLSPKERLERIKNTPKMPERIITQTISYKRSPDVVAEVLRLANNKCENCLQDAPFNRKSDNTPYLEVHHIKFLSDGGEDTIENAIALCPNCHRNVHHGNLEIKIK